MISKKRHTRREEKGCKTRERFFFCLVSKMMPQSFTPGPDTSPSSLQREASTERWLATLRQKMKTDGTQPRVHFSRAPDRPLDHEGVLRDFE